MLKFLKKILTNQYLALIFRLYIGGLFVYASMYKINYTAEFAETIISYEMLPYWAVNITAVFMPWAELICGILLIAGIRVRSASLIICGMMIMFTIGISLNLLRDAPISCGCFHTLGDKISWKTLVRDIIWVVMTIHILLYDKVFHLEKQFSLMIKEI